MNNELKIKPLIEYRVEMNDGTHLTFTADGHEDDGSKISFYRAGYVIREIYHNSPFYQVNQIIRTPVEQGK